MPTVQEGENEALHELHAGLVAAVRESEFSHDEFVKYLGRTKLHKLFYLAGREFNLPITYSWYLAGAYLPSEYVNLSTFKQQYESRRGEANILESDFSKKKGFRREDNNHSLPNKTIRHIRDFYAPRLEETLTTSLNDYLEQFYEEHAPEEYREVYLASLGVRRFFFDLLSELENNIDSSRQISMADFTGQANPTINADYEDYVDSFDRLQMHLTTDSELNSTQPVFDQYRSVADQRVKAVTELDPEEVDDDTVKLVKHLNRFYFRETWLYPSLFMSKNTASGPNRKNLIVRDRKRIENFEEDFQDKISQLKHICGNLE